MTDGNYGNEVTLLDPKEYLKGKRRIVVDTSALLESREGYSGGVPQLVMNCAEELASNPLVIPKAVVNELHNQTSAWRTKRDPELAERANLAKSLVSDLVADGLATTDFGGLRDLEADPEFSTIARAATEMGWEVLFLSADITVKLEVRLLGRKDDTAHTAGVVTTDGLIEIEDPAFLQRKGISKRRGLADKTSKADDYDRLSAALREWPQVFGLKPPPKKAARSTKAPNRRNQQPPAPFANSEPLRGGDRVLEVKSFPGDGDSVHFSRPGADGQLVLAERISRGKEGNVYAIDGEPHLVAKIFKKSKVTTHRKEKVELMVQHTVWLPGICFPESTLSYEGEFVGFTMRRAQDAHVLNDTIFMPQELERLYPGWTRRDLVAVCLSFLKRVKSLHELSILIGDINPNNVMLGNQKDAWIIDIDSVQVEGYPCPVGWDEFTAPEILGGVQGLRSVDHENYAVAVMLFMIMMTGTFPYENSGSDDTVQNIKSGLFPYGFDGRSERELQPPLRWLYVWSHLSYQLKELFWNSFHRDGSRYQPEKRVTVDEWIKAFEGFKKTLGYPDVDPQSLEIFPIRRKAERGAQLRDCPACGGDRFIAQYRLSDDEDWATPSLCNECLPRCQNCGEAREPDSLEARICWPCRRSDVDQAEQAKKEAARVRRAAERAERDSERARRETKDPTRLCERCGKPFITYGNVEWHQRNYKAIPTTHKVGYGGTYPAECVTGPVSKAPTTSPRTTVRPKTSTVTKPDPALQSDSWWTKVVRWLKRS